MMMNASKNHHHNNTLLKDIVDRQSEFPAKLRPSIAAAAACQAQFGTSRPDVLLNEIYKAVQLFFSGRSIARYQQPESESDWVSFLSSTSLSSEWDGPDDTVDTPDQIRLAISFFPQILRENLPLSHRTPRYLLLQGLPLHPFPIHSLLQHPRAISFVPLLAQLGQKMGKKHHLFAPMERGGLNCVQENVVKELFFHPSVNESRLALQKLRELGLLTWGDEYTLLVTFFHKELCNYPMQLGHPDHRCDKEACITEERLRLLIDWNPTLLSKCFRSLHSPNLLHAYTFYKDSKKDPLIFKAMIELGMTHYPHQLGFVFHRLDAYHGIFSHKTFFVDGSEICGAEQIREMFRDQLLRVLETDSNHSTLQRLVLAAATNEEISLDGVYTLFRHNPMALLSTVPPPQLNPDA